MEKSGGTDPDLILNCTRCGPGSSLPVPGVTCDTRDVVQSPGNDPVHSILAEAIEPDVLAEAWQGVRRGGRSPGIDRVTVETYARSAATRLERLRASVLDGTYQPSPYKRVLRPKQTGGFRAVAIPTVQDRILHAAFAKRLESRVGRGFSSRSFAYRVGLGPRRAAAGLVRLLRPDSWVIIADIEKFFDTVDHQRLAAILVASGIDRLSIRRAIEWMRAPVADAGYRLQPVRGLPQGSPLSPLLANLYLADFDRMLEHQGFEHVRFADDFVVIAPSREDAVRGLRLLTDWLWNERGLRIKREKTSYIEAAEGVSFLGYLIRPNRQEIPPSKLEGFRDRLRAILAEPTIEGLPATAKSHNEFALGWESYYAGFSTDIDEQLAELERWRREQVAAYGAGLGVAPQIVEIAFRSMATEPARFESPVDYRLQRSNIDARALVALADDPWRLGDATLAPATTTSSTAENLDRSIASAVDPPILRDGALVVPSHRLYLTLGKGLVTLGRKGTVVFECSPDEIDQVLVTGFGTTISSTVLLDFARRAIPVTLCEGSGAPVGRFVPIGGRHRPRVVEAQVGARATTRGGAIAVAMIHAKLSNQRSVLLRAAKYRQRPVEVRQALLHSATAIAECREALDNLATGTCSDLRRTIFLIEARAAAQYWRGVAALVPPAWGFPGRRHRGAVDPMNIMLNYGYWKLAMRIWCSLEREHLDPSLGLLHNSRHGSTGLVFDAMEEFRAPLVDAPVLALIGRGTTVVLRRDGRLARGTRKRIDRALERAACRETRGVGRPTLARRVSLQASRLRRAITEGCPYVGYRISW